MELVFWLLLAATILLIVFCTALGCCLDGSESQLKKALSERNQAWAALANAKLGKIVPLEGDKFTFKYYIGEA